jgi:hypothetical protein
MLLDRLDAKTFSVALRAKDQGGVMHVVGGGKMYR